MIASLYRGLNGSFADAPSADSKHEDLLLGHLDVGSGQVWVEFGRLAPAPNPRFTEQVRYLDPDGCG